MTERAPPGMSLAQRAAWLLARAAREGECLISHLKPGKSGYPHSQYNRKLESAGRVILLWKEGEPDGRIMRHLCHNKRCINPEHLTWGTRGENAIDSCLVDGQSWGRYGFRMDYEDVDTMRMLSRMGCRNKDLAEWFGVARNTVSMIVNYKARTTGHKEYAHA